MTNPLQESALYILLYTRTSPPTPNNYHWALYHHHTTPPSQETPTPTPSTNASGTKYHIKTEGTGWITEHGTTTSILKQFLLVGAFKIASVPPGYEGFLDRTLRRFDGCLNRMEGVTCRVWVLRVLEGLMGNRNGSGTGDAGDEGSCGGGCGGKGVRILKCDDLDLLEREVLEWGNRFAEEADRNVQPRPVGVSRLCGFDS